jgi:membrane-associated phospholipid phosphatase
MLARTFADHEDAPMQSKRPDLPPYGYMPRSFNEALAERGGFPESWAGDEDAKRLFIATTHDVLAGPLEVADPWALLEHELTQTIAIATQFPKRVKGKYGPTSTTHGDLFKEEDNGELGKSLALYCPLLASTLPVTLAALTEIAYGLHLGGLDLEFKQRLQRPRPYQTAFMIAAHRGDNCFEGFSCEAVHTALSPSYPGGHCYQATVTFAFAYARLRAMGVEIGDDDLDGIAAYAADVPDRRIMAGLHYPLDSVGGWLLARAVVVRSFPPDYIEPGLAFVARAIRRSRVFELLDRGKDAFPHYRKVRAYLARHIPEIDGGNVT